MRIILIDIYNNSFGLSFFNSPFALAPTELEVGAETGRNGFGNIYVFSGGNNGLIGANANYNIFANSRHTIAVAAIDHEGKQSVYSEPGAPLLVSAYSDNGTADNYVGITTTGPYKDDGDDTNDYIRGEFGGTSSAAPLVSGVVALMLEENRNLTARDVQHILVKTAQKNDPDDEDWVLNGAGRWVNHKYGFGAVDALAAVEMATDWTTVADEAPPIVAAKTLGEEGKRIPDDPNSELTSTLTFDYRNQMNVEWVEVEFNAHHEYKGDLEIILEHSYIDNFGEHQVTQSVLAEQHFYGQYLEDNDSYNWRFTSARHWGEPSRGEWTLKVRDKNPGNDSDDNKWTNWKLNIHGTAMPPVYKIGEEFQVNTSYGENGQWHPSMTRLADGGFVVIWDSSVNYAGGILGQRYNRYGIPFGEEFEINISSRYGRYPVVAPLDSGGFVVVWTGSDQGDKGIFGQIYDVKTLPVGQDFVINSYPEYSQGQPSVATLKDGGFIVTWTSLSEEEPYGIYAKRYDRYGLPMGEEFKVHSENFYGQGNPSVNGLIDGGFIITWNDYDGLSVMSQHYNSDGFPTTPQNQVTSSTGSEEWAPSVTGLSDGGFLVTWYSLPENRIYGQKYNSSGLPISEQFQVHSSTDVFQWTDNTALFNPLGYPLGYFNPGQLLTYADKWTWAPSVTELTDGGFVITWTGRSSEQGVFSIYGQRYDSNGNPISEEFQVNSPKGGENWFPSVTALEDGEFMVTWTSQYSAAILAQRFGTSG